MDGEMRLNDDGRMVERWWGELANKFKTVEIDAYVVMPSHIHGIIVTVGADLRVCPDLGGHIGPPLPRMVQWFKTMTANEYIRNVRDDGSAATRTKLWQRNYYEHTIRSEAVLKSIRNYIASNPYRWRDDLENPNFAPGAND